MIDPVNSDNETSLIDEIGDDEPSTVVNNSSNTVINESELKQEVMSVMDRESRRDGRVRTSHRKERMTDAEFESADQKIK